MFMCVFNGQDGFTLCTVYKTRIKSKTKKVHTYWIFIVHASSEQRADFAHEKG